MRWRGPEVPGEFPTLGYQVADFIQAKCVIPDRDQVGEPFVLTDEQLRFLLWFYRVRPEARYDPLLRLWPGAFHFSRGAQLVRPQKWGKGPLAAAIICAEATGPVVFDGWDANGDPVGRPYSTPLIQVTALSEDQSDNVWTALVPMIERGSIAADIPDTGLTRINLPDGGRIEPTTSAATARLGQRITFIAQDQTESWTQRNGGRRLADNQRRNIAGMGGRWLSTPNAWDPAENSVAQWTAEHEHDGVYHDDVEPPESLSVRNKRERRKALKIVYGDSYWVDLDRIGTEIEALLPRDPAQAERWFLNRKRASEQAAFSSDRWAELADRQEVEKGTLITVGCDGARFDDDLGLVATVVETGYQFVLGHWHRPPDADPDYEHPMGEVDGALVEAFDRFDVWRVYVDPGSTAGNIEPLVEKWQGRWGDTVVFAWRMNRPRATAHMVAGYTQAINAGDLAHDGDEAFAEHIGNANRQPVNVYDEDGRRMHVIAKDRPESPRKMDLAAAGALSWEARGDAVAAGAKPRTRGRVVGYA